MYGNYLKFWKHNYNKVFHCYSYGDGYSNPTEFISTFFGSHIKYFFSCFIFVDILSDRIVTPHSLFLSIFECLWILIFLNSLGQSYYFSFVCIFETLFLLLDFILLSELKLNETHYIWAECLVEKNASVTHHTGNLSLLHEKTLRVLYLKIVILPQLFCEFSILPLNSRRTGNNSTFSIFWLKTYYCWSQIFFC